AQARHQGEAVAAAARVGLHGAGERRLGQQRRGLQQADQGRRAAALAHQHHPVVVHRQLVQGGVVGNAAAEVIQQFQHGRPGVAALGQVIGGGGGGLQAVADAAGITRLFGGGGDGGAHVLQALAAVVQHQQQGQQ